MSAPASWVGFFSRAERRLVTAPSTAPEIAPTIPTPAPEPLTFPLSWLMEHASPPIKYRAMTEVARLSEPSPRDIDWLPLSHRPALKLAVAQTRDGMWSHSILSAPSKQSSDFAHVGTIPAVGRLAE